MRVMPTLKNTHRWWALFGAFAVCATASAQPAPAWPSKNIRIVVPYAAGGPADLVARELAQVLTAELKQSVVVENMGGAMGVPALGAVARAEPDGHTLLMAAVGNVVLQPMLSKQGGADLVAKLRPVSTISTAPHVLVVSAKLPIKSVAELVAYAKAHPGEVSFASAGTGGTAHLAMEMFKSLSKTDVIHVPYKGSSGSVNDLISGQVSALFSSLPSLQGLIDKGYAARVGRHGAQPVARHQVAAPDVGHLAGLRLHHLVRHVRATGHAHAFGAAHPAGSEPGLAAACAGGQDRSGRHRAASRYCAGGAGLDPAGHRQMEPCDPRGQDFHRLTASGWARPAENLGYNVCIVVRQRAAVRKVRQQPKLEI